MLIYQILNRSFFSFFREKKTPAMYFTEQIHWLISKIKFCGFVPTQNCNEIKKAIHLLPHYYERKPGILTTLSTLNKNACKMPVKYRIFVNTQFLSVKVVYRSRERRQILDITSIRSSQRICSVKNVFVFSRSVSNICDLLIFSEQIIFPGGSRFFQKALNFCLRTDRFSRKPPILLQNS